MRTPPAPYGRREIACEGFPNQSGLGTVIPLGRWLEFAEEKADSFLGFAWVQGRNGNRTFLRRARLGLLELLTSLPLHLAKLFPVAAPSLSNGLKPASSEPFTFKADRVCGQERFSLNSIRR
jgi:hypothetical protein